MKKLKAQLENQQSAANQDLKNLIQDLRTKKTEAEQDAMYIRHQLTLAQMDKEKVSAILSIRERQITEIRDEMNQLQEVVNEQLVELKNLPYSSVHSSISNITGKHHKNGTISSYYSTTNQTIRAKSEKPVLAKFQLEFSKKNK